MRTVDPGPAGPGSPLLALHPATVVLMPLPVQGTSPVAMIGTAGGAVTFRRAPSRSPSQTGNKHRRCGGLLDGGWVTNATTFRFGPCELDEARRSLTAHGQEIRLQPRVFDLLCYLVRHRERVVP